MGLSWFSRCSGWCLCSGSKSDKDVISMNEYVTCELNPRNLKQKLTKCRHA